MITLFREGFLSVSFFESRLQITSKLNLKCKLEPKLTNANKGLHVSRLFAWDKGSCKFFNRNLEEKGSGFQFQHSYLTRLKIQFTRLKIP